jgi:hypothetical protein
VLLGYLEVLQVLRFLEVPEVLLVRLVPDYLLVLEHLLDLNNLEVQLLPVDLLVL